MNLCFDPKAHAPYTTHSTSSLPQKDHIVEKHIRDSLEMLRGYLGMEELDSYPTTIYAGTAGVLLGLSQLMTIEDLCSLLDTKSILETMTEKYWTLNKHDPFLYSAYMGVLGIEYVNFLFTSEPKIAKSLEERSLRIIEHEKCMDLGWGLGGLIKVLLSLYRKSKSEEYRDLILKASNKMYSALSYIDEFEVKGWKQISPFGTFTYTGYYHGSVGNFCLLLEAYKALEANREYRKVLSLTEKFLLTFDTPSSNFNIKSRIGNEKIFVQYCHGATGILYGLSEPHIVQNSETIKSVLEKCAHTVIDAGPLLKGNGICHGNAGSGLALAKYADATRQLKYKEKSEAFSKHILSTEEASPSAVNLLNGKVGTALFLKYGYDEERFKTCLI